MSLFELSYKTIKHWLVALQLMSYINKKNKLSDSPQCYITLTHAQYKLEETLWLQCYTSFNDPLVILEDL